jgi:hypothetical protein
MRSTRPTTIQTTCDHEDADYKRCHAYAITGALSDSTQEMADRHRKMLATDGWMDHEGRDYCPDHPAA